jgi:PqqD family protein of HPr-rel-A system
MSMPAGAADRIEEAVPWTCSEARIAPPARRCDLNESELDGEGLLYDSPSGRTHRLNHTALFVWRLCDGRRSTREIAEQLTSAYDVDFERALDHVEQILVRLAEAGLLSTAEGPC